jgi:hypothetical protein
MIKKDIKSGTPSSSAKKQTSGKAAEDMTISTLEIAKMVNKPHKTVVEDLRKFCEENNLNIEEYAATNLRATQVITSAIVDLGRRLSKNEHHEILSQMIVCDESGASYFSEKIEKEARARGFITTKELEEKVNSILNNSFDGGYPSVLKSMDEILAALGYQIKIPKEQRKVKLSPSDDETYKIHCKYLLPAKKIGTDGTCSYASVTWYLFILVGEYPNQLMHLPKLWNPNIANKISKYMNNENIGLRGANLSTIIEL